MAAGTTGILRIDGRSPQGERGLKFKVLRDDPHVGTVALRKESVD